MQIEQVLMIKLLQDRAAPFTTRNMSEYVLPTFHTRIFLPYPRKRAGQSYLSGWPGCVYQECAALLSVQCS